MPDDQIAELRRRLDKEVEAVKSSCDASLRVQVEQSIAMLTHRFEESEKKMRTHLERGMEYAKTLSHPFREAYEESVKHTFEISLNFQKKLLEDFVTRFRK